MINGSPRLNGNTSIALDEMKKVFEEEGVEAEIVQVGNKNVEVVLHVINVRKQENVSLMMWLMNWLLNLKRLMD